MVPPALAHPSRGRERPLRRAALALVALAVLGGRADALDVSVAPYMQSLSAGAVGGIEGRVYEEHRKAKASDRPLTGTAVIVVPQSDTLWRTLEDLKRHARDSANDYLEAASRMRRVRDTYERDLWTAGAADLARPTVVDEEGVFRVPGLPAGRWLVIATHTAFMETSTARTKPKERDKYAPAPRVTGYDAVRLWVREVSVEPGSLQSVELTDRNVWFSGVVEHRVMDTGR